MSVTAENRDAVCCSIINQYLFDNVWNEPASEYRINIHPQRFKNKSEVGSFRVLDANIRLPTEKEPYFLWYMKYSDTNLGLGLTNCTWYSLDNICNDFNTLINAYTINGAMLPKNSVYIRYNKSRSIIIIAITKRAFVKVSTLDYLDKLYLTIYYDSDDVKDIKVLSIYVDSIKRIRALQADIDEFLVKHSDVDITEYCNGDEITDRTNTPTLNVGSYYDFVADGNVLFTFDVDLGASHENSVFLSEKDSVWKQIIHIPKTLNRANKVITHNTCDFFIRDMDSGSTRGRYMHRISGNKRSVTQITHNDMGIALFVLDAYRDYLGTQNVGVHVVVRNHDKNNVLIRDASYIDLLYCDVHSDADIVRILSGKGPEKITWWKASELEKSAYVQMMFDSPDAIASRSNVGRFIDALGYYSVANILCKKISTVKTSDAFTGSVLFNLPLMYLGLNVIPIVYLNNKPLKTKYYTYKNDKINNTCKITISSDIYIPTGSTITAIFNLTENSEAYQFTPGEKNTSTIISYNDPVIYRRTSGSTVLHGINTASSYTYELCHKNTNIYAVTDNGDGTYTVSFNENCAGQVFVIENKNATYVKTYELAKYTDTGLNIAIPIATEVTNDEGTVPIIDHKDISVYLNNHYLAKDVDYFVNTVRDSDDKFAFSELVIQTMDGYIEGSSDELTVVYNTVDSDDFSHGFSIEHKLYDKTPINLFFPNITAAHINGELLVGGEYNGTYIKLKNDPYPEGSIWEIKTVLPNVIKNFLNEYGSNLDLNRIVILNEYFGDKLPTDPKVLILESKHRIYSIFMNSVIQAIRNGKIPAVNDPDVNRLKNNVKPYLYLQGMDLVYRTDNDQRFIDYYPQYVNYAVDPATKKVIDAYIQALMPKNVDPTMEVVY